MIITSYGLIIFQLVLWIGVVTAESRKAADRKYGNDMLGFAYQAIPTRHEVPNKPYLQEQNIMAKPTKLLNIAGVADSNKYRSDIKIIGGGLLVSLSPILQA